MDGVTQDLIGAKSFLVIDDEPFSRAVVMKMLKGLGGQKIAEAADGLQAMSDLSGGGGGVDCVICDFNMPLMNGLQLLKAIRTGRDDAPRDLAFIMLTGNADRDLVGVAIQLDVSAFIVKPGSQSTLSSRLTRVFSEQRGFKTPEKYESVQIEGALATTGIGASRPQDSKPPFAGIEDGAVEAIAFDRLEAGDVLAADLVLNGVTVFQRGVSLEDGDVAKLWRLADLAEILGPLGDVKIKRRASPR